MPKPASICLIILSILVVAGVVYFISRYKVTSWQNNMLSKNVSDKIIGKYCPLKEGGPVLRILKDSGGFIGGYVVNLPILDSGTEYLDAGGKEIAVFHFTDSNEKKEEARKIIADLENRFPIEEPLICPKE